MPAGCRAARVSTSAGGTLRQLPVGAEARCAAPAAAVCAPTSSTSALLAVGRDGCNEKRAVAELADTADASHGCAATTSLVAEGEACVSAGEDVVVLLCPACRAPASEPPLEVLLDALVAPDVPRADPGPVPLMRGGATVGPWPAAACPASAAPAGLLSSAPPRASRCSSRTGPRPRALAGAAAPRSACHSRAASDPGFGRTAEMRNRRATFEPVRGSWTGTLRLSRRWAWR